MKILHLTDCFLPNVGGIEKQVSELASHQSKQGHEVMVIARLSRNVRRANSNCEKTDNLDSLSQGDFSQVDYSRTIHRPHVLLRKVVRKSPHHPAIFMSLEPHSVPSLDKLSKSSVLTYQVVRFPISSIACIFQAKRINKEISEIIAVFQPDIIHLHLGEISPLPQIFLFRNFVEIPLVITVHSVWSRVFSIIFSLVFSRIFKDENYVHKTRCNKIKWIAPSPLVANRLVRVLPRGFVSNIKVIPNGVEIDRWMKPDQTCRVDDSVTEQTGEQDVDKSFHIVSTLRLSLRKRPLQLIKTIIWANRTARNNIQAKYKDNQSGNSFKAEADYRADQTISEEKLTLLRDNRFQIEPDYQVRGINKLTSSKVSSRLINHDDITKVRVTIIGQGSLLGLAKMFSPSWITFTGVLSQTEIAKIYFNADLFVYLGVNEAFCLAGMEALNSGLPVLIRAGSGFSSYLTGMQGAKIVPSDKMAQVILTSWIEEWNEKGYCLDLDRLKQQDKDFLRSFTWENVLPKIIDCYEQTLIDF